MNALPPVCPGDPLYFSGSCIAYDLRKKRRQRVVRPSYRSMARAAVRTLSS